MRASVIGCGYLGAVHAAALAEMGHDVVGIDVDHNRVSQLAAGSAPFYEPGLDELLISGIEQKRLRFTTDISAVSNSEVIFLAVGTPQVAGAMSADMRYINEAFASLIPHLSSSALIVGKSTVPVGTAQRLADLLADAGLSNILAWNPEFLREGFAVQDALRPDRLVYGVPAGIEGQQAEKILDEVYDYTLAFGTPKVSTDYATSELVKVAANAFLATKISFINAMSEICDATGADVTQLADAIGHDDRIGRKFLNAGIGFGGGCLPKDIRAFAARAEELGLEKSVRFLHEVDDINVRRRSHVVDQALLACGGSTIGKIITVLGATFKPNSDDVRDSPALDVAVQLHNLGATVRVADPKGAANARFKHPDLDVYTDAETALSGADVVVLATEWKEYASLDATNTRQLVGTQSPRTIIDARNVLNPEEWEAAGWTYVGLGRSAQPIRNLAYSGTAESPHN